MKHCPYRFTGVLLAVTCCFAMACVSAKSSSDDAGAGGSTSGGTGGNPSGSGGSATGGAGGHGIGGGPGSGGGTAGLGGGTGASGGTTGSSGGAPGTGGGGGAGPTDCSTLPFCDTFESSTVGGQPSSTLWTVINGAGQSSATATIDSIGAHGSSKSVKIVAGSRYWLRNSTVIGTLGSVVHARFYVRFGNQPPNGHSALFSTDPMVVGQYNDFPQLRFGVQDMVFHWNTDVDANIPNIDPTNGDPLSFKPDINAWYCVELTINTDGHLNVSVDGQDYPGLAEDGVATTYVDQDWVGSSATLMRYSTLAEFAIGWVPFGGDMMTLWFDDVALSQSAIGCQK
jgi:hypothetical protein